MGDKDTMPTDFVQLAKLALTGRDQDVLLFLRRMARRYGEIQPDLAEGFRTLLAESPTRVSPIRKEGVSALPVDLDSRLQLLRVEQHPSPDVEPIFTDRVSTELREVVQERSKLRELLDAGVDPTRSLLFTGPPGVGKTLAARWLARELDVPLLILDLSAVMSSFLGRTGTNLRQVIDYAKGSRCLLLLDELDAIAKRRDDETEVGELKRLVTVLLQEVDDWPAEGLIVGATNHPDLLDPAVWRRFERRIEFPIPTAEAREIAVGRFLADSPDVSPAWVKSLGICLEGESFSEIQRQVMSARRLAVLNAQPIDDHLQEIIRRHTTSLDHEQRTRMASTLVDSKALSQRRAYELTGVSRDTIRKRIRESAKSNGG